MSRIKALEPAQTTGKARELLDAVQAKLGITPNMTRAMANSPAVLAAYLSFSGALAGGSLSAKLREQIALAVGQANACDYCLSAHSTLGKMAGLSEGDLASSRQAHAADTKADAALQFAQKLVRNRGEVSAAEFGAVRHAGYSDGEIGEIVANVALNLFTNYFNHVAETEIDFPRVSSAAAGKA